MGSQSALYLSKIQMSSATVVLDSSSWSACLTNYLDTQSQLQGTNMQYQCDYINVAGNSMLLMQSSTLSFGSLENPSGSLHAIATTVSGSALTLGSALFNSQDSTVTLANATCNASSNVTSDNSSLTSSGPLTIGGAATFARSTIVASATLFLQSTTFLTLADATSLTLAQAQVTSATVTLSGTSSITLDDTSGAALSALSGMNLAGLGNFVMRRGRARLADRSSIGVPLVLQNTAARRALLQTDLTTTSPALSVCGAEVAAVTVASGASYSVDSSCAFGSETWNIAGVSGTYTTSALANGAVDVAAGGLLVLDAITANANAFSVNGSLTLAGALEVVVNGSSNTGTVALMKWDSASCADVTAQTTLYNCDGCAVAVTASSPAATCVLQLAFAGQSSDQADGLVWLSLLALIPVLGAVWSLLRYKLRSQSSREMEGGVINPQPMPHAPTPMPNLMPVAHFDFETPYGAALDIPVSPQSPGGLPPRPYTPYPQSPGDLGTVCRAVCFQNFEFF